MRGQVSTRLKASLSDSGPGNGPDSGSILRGRPAVAVALGIAALLAGVVLGLDTTSWSPDGERPRAGAQNEPPAPDPGDTAEPSGSTHPSGGQPTPSTTRQSTAPGGRPANSPGGEEPGGSATPGKRATPWKAGVAYQVGDQVKYKGNTYKCRRAHTSQPGQQPPHTPALWEMARSSPSWQAGVQYRVGDRVSYSGWTYECLQAHTSQRGWEPPSQPALWRRMW